MKGAVRFVTAARAVQCNLLRDNVQDIQPALDVVDNGHLKPCLMLGQRSCSPTLPVPHRSVIIDMMYQASPLCLEVLPLGNPIS